MFKNKAQPQTFMKYTDLWATANWMLKQSLFTDLIASVVAVMLNPY